MDGSGYMLEIVGREGVPRVSYAAPSHQTKGAVSRGSTLQHARYTLTGLFRTRVVSTCKESADTTEVALTGVVRGSAAKAQICGSAAKAQTCVAVSTIERFGTQ